ncbi:MAG TPA: peptide chain release factor 1 [Elusimicrobia bacterium]|nr:peptide chain release factor 1 [Elusimicrobiota bacterium]
MEKKFNSIEKRFFELEEILAKPEVIKDLNKYQGYRKEYASLFPLISQIREYQKIKKEIANLEEMIPDEKDKELKELAENEIISLKEKLKQVVDGINLLLAPTDPLSDRNVILEIRAGAGGEEAALFVSDLYRMYARYAEKKGWRIELLSTHSTDYGGFKEIIFLIQGKGVWNDFKYEGGVHRVQRVPVTEASGRIHTSTCSVAVLPEAEEVDFEIKPEDLRIDTFRASGKGGQHLQKTDSAVRITHLPTGLVVQSQDERSQWQNKNKALKILRARLLAQKREEQEKSLSRDRKIQIGTMERAEKIRTYNFPQNRVTDHRIGITLYKLKEILDGELEPFFAALKKEEMLANENKLYAETSS